MALKLGNVKFYSKHEMFSLKVLLKQTNKSPDRKRVNTDNSMCC